jgi:hypothetical protein
VLCAVQVVGLPVVLLPLLLWLGRTGRLSPKVYAAFAGIVYNSYKEQYYWWEIVACLRRLVLVGMGVAFFRVCTPTRAFLFRSCPACVSFSSVCSHLLFAVRCSQTPVYRSQAFCILCALLLVLHLYCQPFRKERDNTLETWSLLFVLLLAILLIGQTDALSIGSAVRFVCLCCAVLCFLALPHVRFAACWRVTADSGVACGDRPSHSICHLENKSMCFCFRVLRLCLFFFFLTVDLCNLCDVGQCLIEEYKAQAKGQGPARESVLTGLNQVTSRSAIASLAMMGLPSAAHYRQNSSVPSALPVAARAPSTAAASYAPSNDASAESDPSTEALADSSSSSSAAPATHAPAAPSSGSASSSTSAAPAPAPPLVVLIAPEEVPTAAPAVALTPPNLLLFPILPPPTPLEHMPSADPSPSDPPVPPISSVYLSFFPHHCIWSSYVLCGLRVVGGKRPSVISRLQS